MNRIMRYFYIVMIFACVSSFAVEIQLIPNGRNGTYYIVPEADDRVSFQVILEEPMRWRLNLDGSLEFDIKLCKMTGQLFWEHCRIIPVDGEAIFTVVVQSSRVSNEDFVFEIRLMDEKSNLSEPIRFRVLPEVCIDASCRRVNFGRLSWSNGCILGNAQVVRFSYSILKNAICEISSQNNFHIRNSDNYAIPYHLRNPDISVSGDIRKIPLSAQLKEFDVLFDPASSNISMPPAGVYHDRLTFKIVSD